MARTTARNGKAAHYLPEETHLAASSAPGVMTHRRALVNGRPTTTMSSSKFRANPGPRHPRPAPRSNRPLPPAGCGLGHVQRLGHKLGDLKEAIAASRRPPPRFRWPRSTLGAPCRHAAWPGAPSSSARKRRLVRPLEAQLPTSPGRAAWSARHAAGQARRARWACACRDSPAAPASSRRRTRRAHARSTADAPPPRAGPGDGKQVVGLDQLEPLVHQGGRVDGDLRPHRPVGVAQRLLGRGAGQLLRLQVRNGPPDAVSTMRSMACGVGPGDRLEDRASARNRPAPARFPPAHGLP